MGNSISNFQDVPENPTSDRGLKGDATTGAALSVKMSNGLTSVVIGILGMALSSEAKTESEQLLALQICAADQTVQGRGTVSFSIQDLAWSQNPTTFASQKEFLLKSIDRSLSKVDWLKLGYNPNEEWVEARLRGLKEMVSVLEISAVNPRVKLNLHLLPNELGQKCPAHHVLLHSMGCVVCNDA